MFSYQDWPQKIKKLIFFLGGGGNNKIAETTMLSSRVIFVFKPLSKILNIKNHVISFFTSLPQSEIVGSKILFD